MPQSRIPPKGYKTSTQGGISVTSGGWCLPCVDANPVCFFRVTLHTCASTPLVFSHVSLRQPGFPAFLISFAIPIGHNFRRHPSSWGFESRSGRSAPQNNHLVHPAWPVQGVWQNVARLQLTQKSRSYLNCSRKVSNHKLVFRTVPIREQVFASALLAAGSTQLSRILLAFTDIHIYFSSKMARTHKTRPSFTSTWCTWTKNNPSIHLNQGNINKTGVNGFRIQWTCNELAEFVSRLAGRIRKTPSSPKKKWGS